MTSPWEVIGLLAAGYLLRGWVDSANDWLHRRFQPRPFSKAKQRLSSSRSVSATQQEVVFRPADQDHHLAVKKVLDDPRYAEVRQVLRGLGVQPRLAATIAFNACSAARDGSLDDAIRLAVQKATGRGEGAPS